MLRELMQGSIDNPKAPISNNWRPSMPANYRPVRTNINFDSQVALRPAGMLVLGLGNEGQVFGLGF